jgi:S-DNA-T family DNA segregation ATPase FtsK/SpoIIIE
MVLVSEAPTRTQRQPQPAQVHYLRDGACVAGLGVAGWGAASMAAPGLAGPAVAATVIATPLVLAAGYRRARRAELAAAVRLAVAGEVRGPVLVKMKRWTGARGLVHRRRTLGRGRPKTGGPVAPATPAGGGTVSGTASPAGVDVLGMSGGDRKADDPADRPGTIGWVGRPRRVKVFYTGEADDSDPRFALDIARRVSSRLLATYVVASLDRSRCRLVLELREGNTAMTQADKAKDRASKLILDLIPTARVRKVEFNDVGEVTVIEAVHDSGTKLVASGYRRRVETTVSAMLPGRFRAVWDMEADFVRFERRPVMPESLWIEPIEPSTDNPLENYDDVEVVFARDEFGEQLVWKPAISPHWIITGATGTAKTSLMHSILVQISRWGWPMWIADGKRIEFLGFRDWPNVQYVASRPEQQAALLSRTAQLMMYRYDLIERGQATPNDFEPLVVFVDEFAELREAILTWYAVIKAQKEPSKPPCLNDFPSLVRLGRTARVHIIASTQRPDVQLMGSGEMRFNFTQRTTVGRLDPDGADMIWNDQSIGVAIPRGIRGRAMATNADGDPVEAQCFRTPNPTQVTPGSYEAELLDLLRPDRALHPRLVIVPPELEFGDEGEIVPLLYRDFVNAEWKRASDRPDLDPLAQPDEEAGVDRTRRASAMTMLGLAPDGSEEPGETGGGSLAELVEQLDWDVLDGYRQQPIRKRVEDLTAGDLVKVDGQLVTVEDTPEEDFEDPDCLVINWRGDYDNPGQLIKPAEEIVEVHEPVGEPDAAGEPDQTDEASDDSADQAAKVGEPQRAAATAVAEGGVLVKFPTRTRSKSDREQQADDEEDL